MSLTLPKTCAMGSSQTALVGTIGVTVLNADGSTHTARATAGIYEIGGGCYGKDITFDDDFKGSIKWDTGGGSPVYAVEEYSYLANNPQIDDLHKFQGLDMANPMIVTPTSRATGTIQQTISGDGVNSTTITRTA